jgi:oxygen-independent coproporphyrinogen-3 oxidase
MSTTTESASHPLLTHSPYEAYTYAYPHKSAYRTLSPAIPLEAIWRQEPRNNLFLYLHVPFCEMRCGFCNLFTSSNPNGSLIRQYLDHLHCQAEVTRLALGNVHFARIAFGGGTPTVLSASELSELLDLVEHTMGAASGKVPFSVETSPETATKEKMELLRARGIDRISLGVQSFLELEASSVGRRQSRTAVEEALACIRSLGFPILNIDLIYGMPSQSTETWLESLQAAMAWIPEEVFLYPLYVRPLTGLQRSGRNWADRRLDLFRIGRDFLLSRGYVQVSMRMFRAKSASTVEGPAYCAQEDGMVGLGCGARSYTRAMQYSTRYAVSTAGVRSILAEYCSRTEQEFAAADYGFQLDEDEQHRRYVALTLLNREGLPLDGYRQRFGSEPLDDLPQLSELESLELTVRQGNHLRLTMKGIELSDNIGPWLYSQRVTQLMESFSLE